MAFLVKVHHDVWPLVLLPGCVGASEFVLRAGLGLQRWRTKTLPEDANEDIAVLDTQVGIDQALWPGRMHPRVGILLPTYEFEAQSLIPGNVAVDLLDHRWQTIPFGLHIAR